MKFKSGCDKKNDSICKEESDVKSGLNLME